MLFNNPYKASNKAGILRLDVNLMLISLYVFFLPFTNVFVLNIGFPLKISEVLLFSIIFVRIIVPAKNRQLTRTTLIAAALLLGFFAIAFASTVINSFWQYDYTLNYFDDVRFGYAFDSFLKLFYIGLSIASFFLIKKSLAHDPARLCRVFLAGGTAASLFCWYLFFASVFHITPQYFNGSDAPPQTFLIPFVGEFYRSGTFKEGNHTGLFLLVCIFLSHQLRLKSVYLFSATLVTTFSTPAILGCIAYFTVYYVVYFLKKRAFLKLWVMAIGTVALLAGVFSNEYVRLVTTNKIVDSEESSDAYSKFDRLELTETGTAMALSNTFWGVGPSNFSLHYNHFTKDQNRITETKRIVNNVYLEIFSETGVFALLLFVLFLALLYRNVKALKLKVGFCIFLIYLTVYPTFTLLFLWFYFAYLLSVPASGTASVLFEKSSHESHR